VLLLWLLEAALRAAPATLVLAPTTAVLLLLPSLLAGQLPRKLEFVGRFALARPERLLVDGPLEWRIAGDLLAINADRSRAGRAGSYYEATTLTLGLESSYPLASALYRLGSREYLWLVAASGSGDCPARVLRRLDVSYVVTHASWDVWPEPYRSLARAAPRVDGLERVRRVTPAALAASAAACPPSPAR
jgi:hypothetical protein